MNEDDDAGGGASRSWMRSMDRWQLWAVCDHCGHRRRLPWAVTRPYLTYEHARRRLRCTRCGNRKGNALTTRWG